MSSCATERYLVKKPYLYEFKKDNKQGYLFGTVHSGLHASDLPKGFWKYKDKSEIVLLLVDTEDSEELKKFSENLVKKMFTAHEGLKPTNVFTPIEQNKILEILKKESFENASLNNFSVYGIYTITKGFYIKNNSIEFDVARCDAV